MEMRVVYAHHDDRLDVVIAEQVVPSSWLIFLNYLVI
jgi:hypothetical protein